MTDGTITDLEKAVLEVVTAYAGSAKDTSVNTLCLLYGNLCKKILEIRKAENIQS